MSEAKAFEAALRDNPDDLAGWCAYADYLVERGDPRGEFMQVQIALEDESRPKKEREALKTKEAELLERHEREWLGGLAPHLLDRNPNHEGRGDFNEHAPRRPNTEHRWHRGFVTELKIDCVTVALGQAMADSTELRLLQKLHVLSTAYYLGMQDGQPPRRHPPVRRNRGYDEWRELTGAPLLKSLRVFQMGDVDGEPPEDGWTDNHTYAPGIEELVSAMPRIEELHLICKEYDSGALFQLRNLKRLRVLRMFALGDPNETGSKYDIRLDVLAANRNLGRLTHLMLHPHFADDQSFIPLVRVTPLFHTKYLKRLTHLQLRLSDMGDDGVREIVASGILKRLKWLDLRHGCITDEGAGLFAACPEAKNLERLDLSRNGVTAAGLATLRAAGVNAVANSPLTQQELESREYLREGDFE